MLIISVGIMFSYYSLRHTQQLYSQHQIRLGVLNKQQQEINDDMAQLREKLKEL